MRLSIRTKLVFAFEATVVIPVLVMLAVGSSKSGGVENALALIITQSALLIGYTSIVSGIIIRGILKPLDELHKATEKIMTGDLDYEIQYKKDNEMGRYCQAFEQMRVQLKESLKKQAALEQSRKELIASISHDLRTPLASIRGYVEGLEDGIVHDTEKFHRYISVIKNKTESLDNLIENLFQYSQSELSGDTMSLCSRESGELLETIVQPFELEFADSKICFDVSRPFPSAEIMANENGLAQVFDNLTSNAKRYIQEQGTIKISADIDGSFLSIRVTDNGSGISQEDMPYIFDIFYRSEKSRSKKYGGAGLGLAICRKIIKEHNGDIYVESVPGIETTFTIKLPVTRIIKKREESLDAERHA